MKYQPFAIWTFALVLGILAGYYYDIPFIWIWISIGLNVSLFTVFFILKWNTKLLTFLGVLIVFGLGIFSFESFNQKPDFSTISKDKQLVELEIKNSYKSSEKYHKYKAKIIKTESSNLLDENILIYIKKDQPILHHQDKILIYCKITNIEAPKNPYQFDYKRFMNLKNIHLQSFTDSVLTHQHPYKFSFSHSISKFKTDTKKLLKKNKFSNESYVYISALALGDRTALDKETQQQLSAAGVMHLFAISGLHTGIIFSLFMILLYPLLYFQHGRIIRIILALCMIWFFAFFVGFTPSVTRAALMITLYYLTFLMQKPTNLIHALFLSAFIILIIQPNQLFDVGFQLSYVAVFFIAWLYKPFRKWFPKYRKPRKNYFFDLLCITLIAQLGVLPLSIYYFHQFSGMFLIGNLILIPIASIMVIMALLSVIWVNFLGILNFIPSFFNQFYVYVNEFVRWIASFENFIIKSIQISTFQLFSLFCILLLLKGILIKFKWKKITPILLILLCFQISRIYQNIQNQKKTELIVFQQYKGSAIGIRSGEDLHVFYDVDNLQKVIDYTILPYSIRQNIENINYHSWQENAKTPYFIKEKNLIKFNHATFYLLQSRYDSLPKTDYIIVKNGSLNPHQKISLKTKKVIADGSNYPSYVQRLKDNSAKIYTTAENGAYVFTVDSINH